MNFVSTEKHPLLPLNLQCSIAEVSDYYCVVLVIYTEGSETHKSCVRFQDFEQDLSISSLYSM